MPKSTSKIAIIRFAIKEFERIIEHLIDSGFISRLNTLSFEFKSSKIWKTIVASIKTDENFEEILNIFLFRGEDKLMRKTDKTVFTKEETRNSLDRWGLISLIPKNLNRVGIFDEYFKKHKAGILKLNNVEISVGDEIYAQKNERWIRTKIVSIQLNDENVERANNGEVGIATDVELGKGFEIYIKLEE